MLNIDNIPFSFDRTTVKNINKLGTSNHNNHFSDGITLTNNILNVSKKNGIFQFEVSNKNYEKTYIDDRGNICAYEFKTAASEVIDGTTTIDAICTNPNFIGFLHLDNRVLPDDKVDYDIQYELLRDNFGNHNLFTIKHASVRVHTVNTLFSSNVKSIKVAYLCLNNYVDVS
jgi:hypothetical protein